MVKDPLLYVDRILKALGDIEADLAGLDLDRFREDRRTRQVLERNLGIISDASRLLPNELKAAEANIRWKEIAGIYDQLLRDGLHTDPDVLWKTAKEELKPLKAAVERIGEKCG